MQPEGGTVFKWRFYRQPPTLEAAQWWLSNHGHAAPTLAPAATQSIIAEKARHAASRLIAASHNPNAPVNRQQPTQRRQPPPPPSSSNIPHSAYGDTLQPQQRSTFIPSQPTNPAPLIQQHQQQRTNNNNNIHPSQSAPARSDNELLQLIGTSASPAPQPRPIGVPTQRTSAQVHDHHQRQRQQQPLPVVQTRPAPVVPAPSNRSSWQRPLSQGALQQASFSQQHQQQQQPKPTTATTNTATVKKNKKNNNNNNRGSQRPTPPAAPTATTTTVPEARPPAVNTTTATTTAQQPQEQQPAMMNLLKKPFGTNHHTKKKAAAAAINNPTTTTNTVTTKTTKKKKGTTTTTGTTAPAPTNRRTSQNNNTNKNNTKAAAVKRNDVLNLASLLTTTTTNNNGGSTSIPLLAAAAAHNTLDFTAAQAVDATTPAGFESFQTDMSCALSCCIGLLLTDTATKSEMYSTLQPLSKEQKQRIKVLVNGGTCRKRKSAGTGTTTGTGGTTSQQQQQQQSQENQSSSSSSSSSDTVVAMVLLPIPPPPASPLHCSLYILPLSTATYYTTNTTSQQQQQQQKYSVDDNAVPHSKQLVHQLLSNRTTFICFNTQLTLRLLHTQLGIQIPPAHHIAAVDPKLLAWLAEPQLLQKSEKELDDYSLFELTTRHLTTSGGVNGGNDGGTTTALNTTTNTSTTTTSGVLSRTRAALLDTITLGEHLHAQLSTHMNLPADTIQREMQIAALLSSMECTGLGLDPWLLQSHGMGVRQRMEDLRKQAGQLAGGDFNLASAQQVADVLYTKLGLPAPTAHGRSAAKTHLPTDENALLSVSHLSAVPMLVLEYRTLMNFLSKFVDNAWMLGVCGGCSTVEGYWEKCSSGGGDWPRVYCSWNQTATATGRLSSSSPNLQAVTKYSLKPPTASSSSDNNATTAATEQTTTTIPTVINVRDAFIASSGCLLLASDYSQVELRVLAHMSQDPGLLAVLRQSGSQGDALRMLAATWLRGKGTTGIAGTNNGMNNTVDTSSVSDEEREQAKRVVYGLIYGISAYGLSQGSGNLGISVGAAQSLIDSFLQRFTGVASFLESVKCAARKDGFVKTMSGRVRPIAALMATDKRAVTEAERKAVNTTIQGSAADIIKAAMLEWSRWKEMAGDPPVRLVAQLHDELIFEVNVDVNNQGMQLQEAVAAVRHVMESSVQLSVPLVVNIKAGERWGSMTAVT